MSPRSTGATAQLHRYSRQVSGAAIAARIRRRTALTAAVALGGALALLSQPAPADILRWDNNQVIPGTEGISPLPGVDLASLSLGYANLDDSSLQSANLTSTYLFMAHLISADLTSANLSSAFPSNADLTSANLRSTNLTFATFTAATLTGADFTGATVRQAIFNDALNFTAAQLYATASYQARDLTGIELTAAAGWDFSNQNLTSADFFSADLTNANLASANLADAKFWQVTSLTGTDFTGANISHAIFIHAPAFTAPQLYSTGSYAKHDLRGVAFDDDDLTGWDFSSQNLAGSSFGNATLSSAKFNFANLTSANLGTATLTSTRLEFANLSSADLVSANVASADFTGAIILGLNLKSATGFTLQQLYSTASYQVHDLSGAVFPNDFTGTDLSDQSLVSTTFLGTVANADFTGAIVRGASFAAGFTSAQLYSTSSYQARDLAGIGLINAAGWNLSSQNLTRARFNTADFSGANFVSADLTSANLASAILSGADLTNAIILGVSFISSNLGRTAPSLTAAQLYSTASYKSGDLTGITLADAILESWNFGGQNLSSAYFGGTDLTSASFSGAALHGTSLFGAALSWANFTGADVRAADFRSSTLTFAQLSSTASFQALDLTGVKLGDVNSWNLSGQNLTSATFQDLTSANLTGANLTSADFSSAVLTSANLSGAIVRGANFLLTFPATSGLTADQLYSTASYVNHDLAGIQLGGSISPPSLEQWNFYGQSMTSAVIYNADLETATFASAHLTGARITYSDLTGADFTSADLTLADLRNTTGFAPAASTILRGTMLPDGTVEGFNLNAGEVFHVGANGSPDLLDGYPANLVGAINIASGASVVIDSGGEALTAVPLVIPPGAILEVQGSLTATGPVAVTLDGGLLRGRGIIVGGVNAGTNPHTIAPSDGASGNSAYKLTLGALATNADTTLAFKLTAPDGNTSSVNDSLNITTTDGLTLNGGTIGITALPSGAASLGYYSLIQFGGAIGGAGAGSLMLPPADGDIVYTLDLEHDPGFLDLHRGLLGDANDDGTVNSLDEAIVDANLGVLDAGWRGGDFNNDGITDSGDLAILDEHFGETIPEPASLLLLAAGLPALLRRSRRRSIPH